MQRRHGEGEVDRKADIAEIEQGRVDDKTDILQHGIEIAPLQRSGELAVKGAGEDQGIEGKEPHDQPHDGQYPGADERVDPLRTERDQRPPQP
ncbi:hypothetical protein D3C73_1480990 [compost metagenome]